MINKQKLWFLTLFSLILVLSVYYITMPSELLTTAKTTNIKTNDEKKVSITKEDILTNLQVEKDEERQALAAEYNEVLTNKDASLDEKNNAYNGLKELDDIKSKEEIAQFTKDYLPDLSPETTAKQLSDDYLHCDSADRWHA